MAETWLTELNGPQREAASHPAGPVLVIAGAGSGKTRTLACRVAWLIEQGVSPDRILLLTFTRRAAAEMLRRAGAITGPSLAGRVWGGTFHSMANRLLRQYGRALGLAPEFTVMDQADSADLMNLIRGELGLDRSKRRFPQKSTLVGIYSRTVNSRTKLGDILQRHYPWCKDDFDGIRRVFERFTVRKREQNVLDYDDLLLYWNALCTLPQVGEEVAARFDHLLVDEYQDTNLIQSEILRAMRRSNANLMVVGDDAQAIYSFRAATIRNILDFPTQFPGTAVITLDQNYRSTQPILAAANAVMALAKERYTKDLFSHRTSQQKPTLVTCLDEAEQCREVCEAILQKREEGTVLKEQAVLFRTGHHSDRLEVELTRRNIPFVKYGGLKFVEAAHVKDLLAILRVMENPSDEVSWFRVLNLLDGIGPSHARRIIEALQGRADDQRPTTNDQRSTTDQSDPSDLSEPGAANGASPLHRLVHQPPTVPTAAVEEFAAFRSVIADCVGMGGGGAAELSPASQIERIRRFYDPIFRRTYDNPIVRIRDLEQLEQIAAGYPARGPFLTDLTLDPPSSTQDLAGPPLLDEDYLILSTIHSAKGCEWDVVHVIHVADGMIPSDMATGSDEEIDEERRLLYVAMTRARNSLSLYFPLRYYDRPRGHGDRHSYAQLTRFIPESIQPLFERVSTPSTGPSASGEDAPKGDAKAIDAMLNDLFAE